MANNICRALAGGADIFFPTDFGNLARINADAAVPPGTYCSPRHRNGSSTLVSDFNGIS